MKIGYARVSTKKQNLYSQTDALEAVEVSRVFTDECSGMKRNRNGLSSALDSLGKGDTLVITRIDRLGRTVSDLVTLLDHIVEKGATLEVLHQPMDVTTPAGRLAYIVSAAHSEFERATISQRTLEGISSARTRGRVGGRAPKLTEEQQQEIIKEYQAGVVPVQHIADKYGVSRPTIYRVISEK